MTKEEFKALIYPLTAKELAEMTGYHKRTIEGWCSGRSTVPNGFIKSNSRRRIVNYYKYRASDFTKRRVKIDLKNKKDLAIKLINEEL